MNETEFDTEAVEEMAETIEQRFEDGLDEPRKVNALYIEIGQVCNEHQISTEDRVDFACAGVDLYLERLNTKTKSDFREMFESMEEMFR